VSALRFLGLIDASGGLSLTSLSIYAALILLPFNTLAGSILAIVAFANYGHRREITDSYNKAHQVLKAERVAAEERIKNLDPLTERLSAVEAIALELQTNAAIAGLIR
jgi:hypothetical protein